MLIVAESFYGNTTQVAEQIAGGLRSKGGTVRVASPGESPKLDGVDLLVVGAPTQMRRLPNARTRQMAQARGVVPPAVGVADWLAALSLPKGLRAAAFDTALAGGFAGSAAKAIRQRLRRLGADVVAEASFIVEGADTPHLVDGEADRAAHWGAGLSS